MSEVDVRHRLGILDFVELNIVPRSKWYQNLAGQNRRVLDHGPSSDEREILQHRDRLGNRFIGPLRQARVRFGQMVVVALKVEQERLGELKLAAPPALEAFDFAFSHFSRLLARTSYVQTQLHVRFASSRGALRLSMHLAWFFLY